MKILLKKVEIAHWSVWQHVNLTVKCDFTWIPLFHTFTCFRWKPLPWHGDQRVFHHQTEEWLQNGETPLCFWWHVCMGECIFYLSSTCLKSLLLCYSTSEEFQPHHGKMCTLRIAPNCLESLKLMALLVFLVLCRTYSMNAYNFAFTLPQRNFNHIVVKCAWNKLFQNVWNLLKHMAVICISSS